MEPQVQTGIQLLLEFGASSPEEIFFMMAEVGQEAQGADRWEMKSGSKDFEDTVESRDVLLSRLKTGTSSSVVFRPKTGDVRYTLMSRRDLSPVVWYGTIEFSTTNLTLVDEHWDILLKASGLLFAALSIDEGPEWTAENIAPEAFPWDFENLLKGAVKFPTGEWSIQTGPGIKVI